MAQTAGPSTSKRWRKRRSGIPGTTKLQRLEENIGATSIELTPDDLTEIDNAAAKITVEGARYPERLGQMTGR